MSLEGDIFGDPNKDSQGDIFASAVSTTPEMKPVALDTPPVSPVSVPSKFLLISYRLSFDTNDSNNNILASVPVVTPVTISAAPSVPQTPVGGDKSNDLFADEPVAAPKKVCYFSL